jgi:4'-phosphopantetheinyl transferase
MPRRETQKLCRPAAPEIGQASLACAWPFGPRDPQLLPGDVHVWAAWLARSDERVQQSWDVLSEDERQRTERFQFPSDRRRFLVARGVLRMLLGRYLGIASSAVRFCYGDFGKPTLDYWHESDLQFNLAHSGELAVYAFNRSRKLGIDVEAQKQPIVIPEFSESSFTARERRALSAVPSGCRQRALLTLWTRKESYLKALGCGLQQDLSSFDVSVPPAPPALLRSPNNLEDNTRWRFYDLDPARDFSCTLCVANTEQSVANRVETRGSLWTYA